MILHDSKSLLAGAAQLDVKPGQFSALVLRVAGTTGGAAADQADVGLVTGSWRDRSFFSMRFDDLMQIDAMELGQVEDDDATPFNYTALIPATFKADGNVFDVTAQDKMTIRVDLSGAAGVAGAAWTGGTISLFGVPSEGRMSYLPRMFQHQPNIAASSTDPIDLPYENIQRIYFFNTTNLDRLYISKDGQPVVQATVAEQLALSNMECRLESAFTAGFVVDCCRSRTLSQSMSDNFNVTLTTGSGGAATPRIIVVSLDFTPDAYDRSGVLVNAQFKARMTRKVKDNRTRPVDLIRKVMSAR